MAADSIETEVKIRIQDPEDVHNRLAGAGFAIAKQRVFEANSVYDTPEGALRSRHCLLRLREVGETTIVTYKGPTERLKHRSREELETTLGNGPTARLILERLGYVVTFRYEKYRTEFERPGERGIVTLDHTPVGWFIELEGEAEWIDSTAVRLGFSETEYITDSYGTLYLLHCAQRGIRPTNMIFGESS